MGCAAPIGENKVIPQESWVYISTTHRGSFIARDGVRNLGDS